MDEKASSYTCSLLEDNASRKWRHGILEAQHFEHTTLITPTSIYAVRYAVLPTPSIVFWASRGKLTRGLH